MKLSYAEFVKSKDTSSLGHWCLFFGPEPHLKREALARVRREAREAAGDEPSWETLDGRDLQAREVLKRCQMGALFGGARVIVVREVEQMDHDQQAALGKVVEAGLPPGVTVILVTGETGGRNRARRRAVKAALRRAVEEHGVAVEFARLKVAEAARWAVERAKQLGKKMEPAAARKLVQQRVGTGLGEIEMELEKLAVFVGDGGSIGTQQVDEVTPRLVEEDVFRLVDAVARKEAGRAASILRGLLREKRESPGRILWLLAQEMRMIWGTKLLLERGWKPGQEPDEETAALLPQDDAKNALAQFARKPWLAKRTVRQARALSWGQVAGAVQALNGCDLAIKGIRGKLNDEALALELLLVELCTGLEMPVWETAKGERVLG